MRSSHIISALSFGGVHAYFSLTDPSEQINPVYWVADNAIPENYSYMPASDQYIPNVAPYTFSGKTKTLTHEYFKVDKNDTSVVIVTDDAEVTMQYVTVVKEGYNSDLYQASFYGVNAAVLIANQSTAYISDINVTVHNGAANIYTYGAGTTSYVNNAWLYSSGPVSHGLYASTAGTVYGTNIVHYSGGIRSSSFSGDAPEGYVHVTGAVAHTDGIGSATCYALGLCNMTNVIGHNSNAPSMFMDGTDTAIWTNCDLTAGLLAGMVIFSGMSLSSGGVVTLDHTRLTVLRPDMPALWFGNVEATAYIIASTLNTTLSDLLFIANFSQVTQSFDGFVGYDENSGLSPGYGTVYVEESALYGDMVAYNGSVLDVSFSSYSSWTGKGYSGYETSYISISLDETSTWTLTGPTTLTNLTDANTALTNIYSRGHDVYYDGTSAANDYLANKTIHLHGGGKAMPAGSATLRAKHGYWGGYGATHGKTPEATPAPWGLTAPGDVFAG